MRRLHGITLGETLVVIAILALLAALLFPVFATVKEAAYETQETSQLRQLALARGVYMNDFDDDEPGSTVQLIATRHAPVTLVRSPLDPFKLGWANEERDPLSPEPKTGYKDSFPTLRRVSDPVFFPRYVESENGGWLIAAGRSLKGIAKGPVIARLPYKRLTFAGGVIRRTMPIEETPNSMTLKWSLLYSDEDVLRGIIGR